MPSRRTFAALDMAVIAAAACLGCARCPERLCTAAPSRATAPASADAPLAPVDPVSAPPAPYRWKSVNVLGGGFVTGIVFSPIERDLIYARTDIGGAYRWDPKDSSWVPITDMLGRSDSNLLGIESIAADPVDPSRVYLAAGTYTQPWAGPGAILRSSDRGATFQRTLMPIKMGGNENGRSNGERLAIDPNDPRVLYFGSRRDGLWRSSDHAESFVKVESFPVPDDPNGLGLPFVLFDAKSGVKGKPTRTLYVGVSSTEKSLYFSTDAGAAWKPVPNQPVGLMPSHAAFDATGMLYVAYGNVPGPSDVTNGAVFRYDPRARRFTDITPARPTADDQFGYGGLAVDAQRPGTLLVTTIDRWTRGDEIYRTTDGGQRWTALGPRAQRDAAGARYLYWGREKPSATGWMGDVDLDPFDSARALYVTGQGVWGSDDVTAADSDRPTHWSFRVKNLEETVALDLVSPPSGPPLLSGLGDICGFRHDDVAIAPPSGMFQNPIFGNVHGLDFAGKDPRLVVRVGTANEAKRGAFSDDGGKSWRPFGSEPAGSRGAGAVALSADGAAILWAPKGSGPSLSRDRGATWQIPDGAPPPGELPEWAGSNLKLAADRTDPERFYVFDAKKGDVHVSADAGARFERTATGLPTLPDYAMSSGSVRSVPGRAGELWITTGKGLYHSTDGGKRFAEVTVDESHSIGIGPAAPGQREPALFLIGKLDGVAGFFRSDDGGASFFRINDERSQFGGGLNIVADGQRPGRVYVGTHGRGILYGDPG